MLKVFTLFKQVSDGYYLLDEIFSIVLRKFTILNSYLVWLFKCSKTKLKKKNNNKKKICMIF